MVKAAPGVATSTTSPASSWRKSSATCPAVTLSCTKSGSWLATLSSVTTTMTRASARLTMADIPLVGTTPGKTDGASGLFTLPMRRVRFGLARSASATRLATRQSCHRCGELADLDRLGQMAVVAGLAGALARMVAGVAGDGQRRDAATLVG